MNAKARKHSAAVLFAVCLIATVPCGIASAWLSVQQAAPSNASRAPIPQGATSIVGLQLHGSKKYDLKILASNLPQGMPSPQSLQAGPSPSPPGRTSTSCQPWLLLSGES